MTWATAMASWIGEPSKPYERSWKAWKKSDSSATKRPARPESRRRSAGVRVGRRAEVAPQGCPSPGGDRDVAAAGDLERDERIPRRLVERLVAGHRGHAQQLDLR